MTIYININKHRIASNAKRDVIEPPIRFSKSIHAAGEYCNELAILDDQGNEVATVIYSPHKPIMKFGARLIIKAAHGVQVKA